MSEPDGEATASPISYEDARGYLFDMLIELAKIANGCGEVRIAMVLNTITAVLDDRSPITEPFGEPAAS